MRRVIKESCVCACVYTHWNPAMYVSEEIQGKWWPALRQGIYLPKRHTGVKRAGDK